MEETKLQEELTPVENEVIDKETMAEIFSEVLKGKRPEGMPYEMYKQIRTLQTKKIKDRKGGQVMWPANVERMISKEGEKEDKRWFKNKKPFVKKEYEAFVEQEKLKEIERIKEQNKAITAEV